MEEILSDNEYQIISNSLQDKKNIRRKANLNFDEINTCLISHTLEYIDEQCEKGNIPSISELLTVAAQLKEELSLSRNAFGLGVYKDIMSRELKLTDKFRKKDEKKRMDVE